MARMLKLGAVICAAALLLTGCNRMTPEERLQKMAEAIQQGDVLGAELEGKKLIEKHPDDPAAMSARVQLAAIYQRDGRLDEAASEYQAILDSLPPGSMDAMRFMGLYNQILKQQRRFPEAYALVEKYEKEFANNNDVLLNMKVARADLKIATGETSEARSLIRDAMGMTTNPLAQQQFRDQYMQTFVHDQDTTGMVEYLKQELAKQEMTEDVRRRLTSQLAVTYSEMGDYEQVRRTLEEATRLTEDAVKDELDLRIKTQHLFDLAMVYATAGNLEGAERVLRYLYEVNTDSNFGPFIVPETFRILVRQGKKQEALGFIKVADQRYNSPELKQQIAQVEAGMQTGQFDQRDTGPMVLQFEKDSPVLPNLQDLGVAGETTGTVAAAGETTGVAAAVAEEPTTGSEPAAQPPAPVPTEDATTTAPQADDAGTSPPAEG